MQYSTAELIRLIGEGKAGAPEPGDIYIVNDPYLGGTHLMDVRFALPFYYRGEHYLLAAEHGALARHRRHGAGRLLGPRHRGGAGGAAAAAGEAVQARRDGCRDLLPS